MKTLTLTTFFPWNCVASLTEKPHSNFTELSFSVTGKALNTTVCNFYPEHPNNSCLQLFKYTDI